MRAKDEEGIGEGKEKRTVSGRGEREREGEGEGGSFVSDTVHRLCLMIALRWSARRRVAPSRKSSSSSAAASSSGFWRGFAFSHSGILLLIETAPSCLPFLRQQRRTNTWLISAALQKFVHKVQ